MQGIAVDGFKSQTLYDNHQFLLLRVQILGIGPNQIEKVIVDELWTSAARWIESHCCQSGLRPTARKTPCQRNGCNIQASEIVGAVLAKLNGSRQRRAYRHRPFPMGRKSARKPNRYVRIRSSERCSTRTFSPEAMRSRSNIVRTV